MAQTTWPSVPPQKDFFLPRMPQLRTGWYCNLLLHSHNVNYTHLHKCFWKFHELIFVSIEERHQVLPWLLQGRTVSSKSPFSIRLRRSSDESPPPAPPAGEGYKRNPCKQINSNHANTVSQIAKGCATFSVNVWKLKEKTSLKGAKRFEWEGVMWYHPHAAVCEN